MHVIYRHWLNLWFFVAKFEFEVFPIFSFSLVSLFLFYPPCFKCSSLVMHHACNVFCEVRVWASLRYEPWTFCISTRGHCNLASKLVLHNLQDNTAHLLLILVLGLLSFKVCMSNLYSSTTNGCLRQDHLVCFLPTFDGLGGIPSLEQTRKLNYFSNVSFFPLTHLCHCMLLMRTARI
jgi:hypothetical protein